VSVIEAEVCYAGPEGQFLLRVRLEPGATIADAIEASGIRTRIPKVRIDDAHVGVFARPVTLATVLRAGDRVEIYRPLKIDPRQARRERVERARRR
jgi:putative ubiquitin-RnfH superfamily antitoxin RatB of RatAB toxin-antitoxin module